VKQLTIGQARQSLMRELPSKSLVPVSCRPITSSLGQLGRRSPVEGFGLPEDHRKWTAPQKITFAEMRDMGVRGILIALTTAAATR
jgi:hypothetical protein